MPSRPSPVTVPSTPIIIGPPTKTPSPVSPGVGTGQTPPVYPPAGPPIVVPPTVPPGPGSGQSTTANTTPSVPSVTVPVNSIANANISNNVIPPVTPQQYIEIQSNGTLLIKNAIALNFTGLGVIATANNSVATLNISSTSGPILLAYNSVSQNISVGSSTMNLVYSTATVNTGTYYNTTTGIFAPTVAGYYQVNALVYPTGGTYGSFFIGIYKNGSAIAQGTACAVQSGWGQPGVSLATTLVYLNGLTDYINCKLITTSATGAWTTITGIPAYFQAVWLHS